MTFLWAAFSIAALHTLLPSHWLPYVSVAKANRWPLARLWGVTLGGMLLHLLSTAILLAMGLLLSYGLSHTAGHAAERVGGALLLVMALLYLLLGRKIVRWQGRMAWLLAVGVGIQPCVEVIPLLLAAAATGVRETILVGVTWAITTLLFSFGLVTAAYWGIKLGWARLSLDQARWVTGLVLLLAGLSILLHVD